MLLRVVMVKKGTPDKRIKAMTRTCWMLYNSNGKTFNLLNTALCTSTFHCCLIIPIVCYSNNTNIFSEWRKTSINKSYFHKKGNMSKSTLKCNYQVFLYTGTPQNYYNRQESILLICVRSNNHDNYEFGYACIGIFDYQIIGF